MKANKSWPGEKVVSHPVAQLTAYAGNARKHSAEQVEQIAAAIKEWGWTTPVLIDEQGGVIAGHGRLAAAKLLGLEEVPCIVANGWTPTQKRAYVLADNQIAENATWDRGQLALELDVLNEADFSLELTGFGNEEVVDLFNELEGLDSLEEAASSSRAEPRPRTTATEKSKAENDELAELLGEEAVPDELAFGALTALERTSGPMRFWQSKGYLGGEYLDFGCGRDETAEERFDPFHAPDWSQLLRRWQTITCNYVLNVQPTDHLVLQAVALLHGLLEVDGQLLLSVWNSDTHGVRHSNRGWQNHKPLEDWERLLGEFFAVEVKQSRGTFFAFVCRPLLAIV